MKRIAKKLALKIVLLAISASFAPVLAGEDGLAVRNCTWCHGTSAQGYMVAPRLAGQQPAYMLKQIKDLREHTRDNPFSRQYMWGVVVALDPQSARDLAAYFASIRPKPGNDGDSSLAAAG